MAVLPAPIIWPASSYWDGNDGLWNSFVISVGTPAQEFRVLPSTSEQETWIPVPEGCTSADPADPGYCGFLRGALPTNGANSSGFAVNQSATWDSIGIYTLTTEEEQLGYDGDGLYGYDTVVIGDGDGVANLTQQVVAGIATPDFWLGIFGLGTKGINFTTFTDPVPSYISNLLETKKIPSPSWGYTAGAAYRNRAPASLTLGGYDASRIASQGLSFLMNEDNSRPLQVGLQNIIGLNTPGGGEAVNFLSTPIYEFIDSTIPHIWLPDSAVDAFVSAFGLEFDNTTDLFLINDTMRSRNIQSNPTITFQLGVSALPGENRTVNIELPYAAFDLQASYPLYDNATNYFPIRRAVNESQYTLGRTLFQEAYVIVDYDRNNFTVSQASFDHLDNKQIIAVERPGQETSTSVNDHKSKSHLSSGGIAGVVVACIAGTTFVLILGFILLRRFRTKAISSSEYADDGKSRISELTTEHDVRRYSIPKDSSITDRGSTIHEALSPAIGPESGWLAELSGDVTHRYELTGTMRGDKGGWQIK